MYHPTTRVLTVLELLQSHREISGPEIAARLEVDVRTVRRYIAMLEDLGIPVIAERGRYGAYRLMPGFKLPPLMFSEDEALAVTLGLLVTRQVGLGGGASATEGALAKITRVMPEALRDRLRAVQEALIVAMPDTMRNDTFRPRPASETVLAFSMAVQMSRRIQMRYRAFGGEETERAFDPYGLVYREGFWYTVGYCHLRRDLRTFRVERVQEIALLEDTFVRPAGFDALDQVERSIARTPGAYWLDVLLHTSLDEAQKWISRELAVLDCVEGDGVPLRCYVQNIDWAAAHLMRLPFAFTIREPDALREALRRLAARALERADSRSEVRAKGQTDSAQS